jgi:hypothetical protein
VPSGLSLTPSREIKKKTGSPGWGLDSRLMTLPCKEIIVAKFKEVKTGCNLAKSSKEGYGSKRAVLPIMMIKRITCKGKVIPLLNYIIKHYTMKVWLHHS